MKLLKSNGLGLLLAACSLFLCATSQAQTLCDATEVLAITATDIFGEEVSWTVSNADGEIVAEGSDFASTSAYTQVLCLTDGCYTVTMLDSFGDGWNGALVSFISGDSVLGTGSLAEGEIGTFSFGVNTEGCGDDGEVVFGCTDPNACNYNEEADADDQSCTYPGCTDPEALNYDANAGCDDDSCEYPVPCEENTVSVALYDTFGDGWNGGYYTISTEDGELLAEGTMLTGEFEVQDVCLGDGCYVIEVFAGAFADESSWEVIIGDVVAASGGTPGIASFGINVDGCSSTFGCTDADACNFNADANVDDGSCTYPGCTDPNAINFDPVAGCDDGSCDLCEGGAIAQLYVCTWCVGSVSDIEILDDNGDVIFFEDDLPDNSIVYYDLCLLEGVCYTVNMYNTESTGWCDGYYTITTEGWYQVSTGTLGEGENFGQEIFSLDGSCEGEGCTDPEACNYDEAAEYDDDSCTYPGCTDPDALNYNADAGCDDDSCEYPEPCDDTTATLYLIDTFGDGWNGATYSITDENGNVVASGGLDAGELGIDYLCLADGCYSIEVGGGTFDSEILWELVIGDTIVNGTSGLAGFGVNADGCEIVSGCTDAEACNYNEEAVYDNGTCTYPGCTDPIAFNYDPWAGCDDGSCETCDEGVPAQLYICTWCLGSVSEFEILDDNGNVIFFEGDLPDNSILFYDLCLDEGICYTVNMYNTESTGWCDGYYTITTADWYQVSTGALGDDASFGQEFFSLDGSCPMYGCTDEAALNYDPEATEDDGSCAYPEVCEATEVQVNLYDSFGDGWNGGYYYIIDGNLNTVADGTLETGEFESQTICLEDGCFYIGVEAGLWPEEISWEVVLGDVILASGGVDDSAVFGVNSDCEAITGCTDPEACNYNEDAWVGDDSCTYPGCTDPDASNYDQTAGCDDGSCTYPEPCDANSVVLFFTTQIWAGEISMELVSDEGEVVFAADSFEDYTTYAYDLCLEDGCYTLHQYDAFGDGWNGAWFLFSTGDELIAEGSMFTGSYQTTIVSINGDCGVAGCTDPDALNYNPAATVDNGTCLYEDDFDPSMMMVPDLEANIAPNPVVDFFELQLKNIVDENGVIVNIYDMTGRVVYENTSDEPAPVMTLEIDATTLESGYYVVNVVNGTQTKSVMLVKQH